ncbi:MAG: tRNA (N6-isopentenyl adenosine(37)-C2)-methylthiotransferase MiaB [Planctomycetota bacterium]
MTALERNQTARTPYPMALAPASAATVARDRRVYFEVFGCQMNKLDAELMLESMIERGYALTHDASEAGVILFNTCSIREHSEDRVYSRIGALRRRKAAEPELVIGLLGCIAQHREEQLLKRLPHVDLIVGTREFHRVPDLVDEVRGTHRPLVATELDSPFEFQRRRNLGPNPYQAYVSVMRGCDMVCTYCVVPTTRGKELSRPPTEILDECRRLADQGVREVTFLGQTVNSYGKRLESPGVGLHTLLRGVETIGGLERVRFITSHPRFMRPTLIEAMAQCRKSCEYLHLPVQSGSDTVLARMKRTYTREYYLDRVERLRSAIPNLVLATDFIVGFPGETEREFEESLALIGDARIEGGYVFKYSPRPGTASYAMVDDVPEETKKVRHQAMLAELQRVQEAAHRRRIGCREQVLVEGPSKSDPTRLMGRTRDFRIVVWPAGANDKPGDLVDVVVESVTSLTLLGRRVDGADRRAQVV